MAGKRAMAHIDEEIGRLADLSRKDLVDRWIKAHGCPPPKGVKRGLLERACAYKLQTRSLGGLRRATAKALLAIAEGATVTRQAPSRELRPGTRLIREWHGVTHQVNVTETGFDWNGQPYASLSAVARAITGTNWSGPRFFGL